MKGKIKSPRVENVLDLVAVNNPSLLNWVKVVPGSFDHDVVFAEMKFSSKKYKQIKLKVPIYRKADWNKTEEEMKEIHSIIENKKERPTNDTKTVEYLRIKTV